MKTATDWKSSPRLEVISQARELWNSSTFEEAVLMTQPKRWINTDAAGKMDQHSRSRENEEEVKLDATI
ncbi:unnamed protein product [Caenorhabditis nigoni]